MAEGPRRLTRRRLVRSGGASLAGAAVLGATGLPGTGPRTARAQGGSGRDIPNVLLIAVDGIRADFVSAYDDPDDRADTPNLDELAKNSLRFDRAVPEAMPAFPSRRGLLSGMRSYPFRDWQPTEGLAQYPGWHPIWDHQPILTETLENAGVTTLYISDNPLLDGARFRGVARKPAGSAPDATQVQRLIAPAVPGGVEEGGDHPAKRVMDSGIKALGELKRRQPFFLGVDVFDRIEATDPTPVYARPDIVDQRSNRGAAARLEDVTPVSWRPFEAIDAEKPTDSEVRDHYAAEVKQVDGEVGRLLDALQSKGLAENTVVYFVSPTTVALGEHGVFGMAAAAGHEDVYRAALMIRDPQGRRKNETSRFHAAPPDMATTVLAYMGVTAPGKMAGEDLNGLLDEDDVHPRPNFAIRIDEQIVASDGRLVLISEGDGRPKRLYDTDPDEWEDDHSDDDDFAERDEDKNVSREDADGVQRLWQVAMTAAGGTLPKFGPDGPVRPRPEIEDDSDSSEDEGRLDRDDDLNFQGRSDAN
ncbi:hypothetical protein BH20ACT20_BH20ACT20_10360 [soil metagenome]